MRREVLPGLGWVLGCGRGRIALGARKDGHRWLAAAAAQEDGAANARCIVNRHTLVNFRPTAIEELSVVRCCAVRVYTPSLHWASTVVSPSVVPAARHY